jgi:hypothetical protein
MKKAFVRMVFEDSLYDLSFCNVVVNDVPLHGAYGKPLTGRPQAAEDRIELTKGRNKIETSCTNSRGAESYRAVVYADYDSPTSADLYFLGFGVSVYRDESLHLA